MAVTLVTSERLRADLQAPTRSIRRSAVCASSPWARPCGRYSPKSSRMTSMTMCSRGVRGTVGPGGWRNAFRFTDHIGRSVFVDDEPWVGHEDELPIPDPSSPGNPVAGHNNYWREGAVMKVVEDWSQAEVSSPDA